MARNIQLDKVKSAFVVFIGVVLLVCVLSLSEYMKEKRYSEKTMATVTSCIDMETGSKSRRTHYYDVEWQYEVNGQTYLVIGHFCSGLTISELKQGATIEIKYDPDNPVESLPAAWTGSRKEIRFFMLIAATVMLIATYVRERFILLNR